MSKHEAENRAAWFNSMAKREEYCAMRTDAGEWFVARTFVATLDDGHASRAYIGISVS